MTTEYQNCPICENEYLAIRTDIYKDGRKFVYCDSCGCLADERVWNSINMTKPYEVVTHPATGLTYYKIKGGGCSGCAFDNTDLCGTAPDCYDYRGWNYIFVKT